ncbi:MAG: ribonuclease III family protein [Candidatus Bathyarchaeia archaeon]
MKKSEKIFSLAKNYDNISEILKDHNLASLGDTYVNFVYALALSRRKGKPSGTKVKGSTLAEAIKKAGLREFLPSRMSRHVMADAAESLIVYGWLNNYITLEESVATLEKTNDVVDGFCQLLKKVKDRIIFP